MALPTIGSVDPPEGVDAASTSATTPAERLVTLQGDLIETARVGVERAYKAWDTSYRASAEVAVSFIGVAILIALLIIEGFTFGEFTDAEFVALVSAATILTVVGVTGHTLQIKAKEAARAEVAIETVRTADARNPRGYVPGAATAASSATTQR